MGRVCEGVFVSEWACQWGWGERGIEMEVSSSERAPASALGKRRGQALLAKLQAATQGLCPAVMLLQCCSSG